MNRNVLLASALTLGLLAFAVPCYSQYALLWEVAGGAWGLTNNAHPVPIGDFDGDGRAEIASVQSLGNPVLILDGMSGEIESDEITIDWVPQSIMAVDLDSDGTPEIVMIRASGPSWMGVIDYVGTTAIPPPPLPPSQPPTGDDGHIFDLDMDTNVHPNPFNPTATIDYSVPAKGTVGLRIYDASGRLIRTLVDGVLDAGAQSVVWDGRDDVGQDLASGVYYYELRFNGEILDTGKAVALK